MNIKEVKTVQDLLKANLIKEDQEELKKSKELLSEVYKLDPAYGKAIAIHILENLLGYHCSMVEHNIEAGDTEFAMVWQRDGILIDEAVTLMNRVTLLSDNGDEIRIDEL
jgi:hypothetical protein